MNIERYKQADLTNDFWRSFDGLVQNEIEHSVQFNSCWIKSYMAIYLQDDQVEDYAKRKNMPKEQVERWLGSVIAD